MRIDARAKSKRIKIKTFVIVSVAWQSPIAGARVPRVPSLYLYHYPLNLNPTVAETPDEGGVAANGGATVSYEMLNVRFQKNL